jgi:hypothetical protein
LFLSNKCETCSIIARSFAGSLPQKLWVVVVPVFSDATEFITEHGLTGDRVIVDQGIADRIGLDITPAALVIDGGRLIKAHTVPSVRQVYASLPDASARGRALRPKSAA